MFLSPNSVIMQPQTLCNLDCKYCYLPFRKTSSVMPIEVARAVATSIQPWTRRGTVEVCWHGGEPLTTGRFHLGLLMDEFSDLDVVHSVQTNATLIDEKWCEFFADRLVHVGVSVDGDAEATENRVDRRGEPAYGRIMRGIELLQQHQIEFSAISVVSNPSPTRARELYSFASSSGIETLGVNIEETEGLNTVTSQTPIHQVQEFWSELLLLWRDNPAVRVRELDRALGYARHVIQNSGQVEAPRIDPLPTVAYDGTVTLISPELAGFSSLRYGNFDCGNVTEENLDDLIKKGRQASWVTEYENGVDECRKLCPYFSFCGGGHPSNRYFENGRFDGTETNYCRNSKIALMEGVLDHVHSDT